MRALDEEEGARTASRDDTTSSRGYEGILRAERAAARERGLENASSGMPPGETVTKVETTSRVTRASDGARASAGEGVRRLRRSMNV